MEGTRPNAVDYGGHPAPDGASPTQPYKCGLYVKVNTVPQPIQSYRVPDVGAELVYLGVSQNFQPLQRQHQRSFDFNILTAFIRLGRAGPAGAGCPPILYGLRLGRAGPAGAGCPPILYGLRLGRARPAGAGCPPILYGLRLGRARPAGAGCPPYYYFFYYY